MKTTDTILRAKVNKTFARKSERIFARLGLSTDEAINIFLARVSEEKGIPFPVRLTPREDNSDILAPAAVRHRLLESFYES